METGLANKVVLITGASGGIGSAIARAFSKEQAKVIIHYRRNRKEALRLQKILQTESIVLAADLGDEKGTRDLFKTAIRHFGRIDTLVNNAGSWENSDVPIQRMKLAQWQETYRNVLTSSFFCLREFFRQVERQKEGNVVLIASTAAIFGEANHADYASAKSAMAYGLLRTLKNEIVQIAPHRRDYPGGRVNCICPGWTVVPRTTAQLRDKAKLEKVTSTMAIPQVALPEDIANAAVFLSSDRLARHITGQSITIAGGMEGRKLWNKGEADLDLVEFPKGE